MDTSYVYKGPNVEMSDFAKFLLTIMRARRDYDITTLAIIIGRDTGRVSRYFDQWIPMLGKVGSYLSILDMDLTADFMTSAECKQEEILHYKNHPDKYKNFFDACIPNKFVNVGIDLIGSLLYGKDFLTDTTRLNSALTRSQWSNKTEHISGRLLCWITSLGLNFEHTPMYLACTTENHLVELWGAVREESPYYEINS